MNKDILVVFDLDFTLWDCGGVWLDCTSPPFTKQNGHIIDTDNRCIRLYPDVRELLSGLTENQIAMGLASRTGEPSWALELLAMFGIGHFFQYKEIYPSGKSVHFRSLQSKTGIPYNKMYFFDDEYRNIEEVSRLGVNCLLVEKGVNKKMVLDFIKHR